MCLFTVTAPIIIQLTMPVLLLPLLLSFSTFLLQSSLTWSLNTTQFNFSSFDLNSCSNGRLICMGSVRAGDGHLSLGPEPEQVNDTASMENQIGRVLYTQPVLSWPAMIFSNFTVKITPFSRSAGSADGMTFIMAQDNKPSPSESYGSYLGIMDKKTQGGVTRQIAVELDTFPNEFDPDGNHVGVDTVSITSPVAAVSLNRTGIYLATGNEINVSVEYDPRAKKMRVYMGYNNGTPLARVIDQPIKMKDIVPSFVYVGFTAATGKEKPESHQVLSWSFSSVPVPGLDSGLSKSDKLKISVPVAIGGALLVAALIAIPLVRRRLRKRREKIQRQTELENMSKTASNYAPKTYTYKQLAKATHNFSKENLLGTGGFGSVYKGIFSDPPATVAVKKISANSKQGESEYLAEICTIGRLRHKNIVQLQGWCHDGDNLLLVYEYMPNGSLDGYIGKKFLDWETRYNILTGLASALLYLHEECHNPVVHRDIKPNNVLLDSEHNAHLGDFGLARLLENDSWVTTTLAGTPGYLAPEVSFTGKATPESDVYSFGMVVLELVSGRRSKGVIGDDNLLDYVWDLNGRNSLPEAVDPMLEGKFDEEQVKRALLVALACLHPYALFRPKTRKIVQIFLNPNEPLMHLPETKPYAVFVSGWSISRATIDFGSRTTATTDFGSTSTANTLGHPVDSSRDEIEIQEHDDVTLMQDLRS